MNKIYEIAEFISKKTNFKKESIFLVLNVSFWILIMAAISITLILLNNIKDGEIITTIIMFVGYPVMFLGFFGGALFLYRK